MFYPVSIGISNGFVSMLKKVKLKPKPCVIIHMQALVKRKAAELVGNAWDITDEVESDFEDRPVSKKVRNQFISVYLMLNLFKVKLDDALEVIVKRLSDKYFPGLCSLHHDLSRFHHRTSNLHFNLNHPQLLVWAQAIKLESAMYEKVPTYSLQ